MRRVGVNFHDQLAVRPVKVHLPPAQLRVRLEPNDPGSPQAPQKLLLRPGPRPLRTSVEQDSQPPGSTPPSLPLNLPQQRRTLRQAQSERLRHGTLELPVTAISREVDQGANRGGDRDLVTIADLV